MFISMKSFKASNVFFVLLMAFALSSQLVASVEEKFSISKTRKSAKAVVGANQEFTVTFDPPLASKVDDYKPEDKRNFYLTVGSCKLGIRAGKKDLGDQNEIVTFDITDPIATIPVTANSPADFKVSASDDAANGVEFDKLAPICKNKVKFEPYPADATKFLVEVSLDGNFPDSLVLKSDDATLYVDPSAASNKEASNKETSSGKVLPTWAWILIGVGAFLVFVIIAITVSICVKRRKQKTFHKIDPTLHTAIEKAKLNDHIPTAARAKDGKRNVFEKSEKTTTKVTQTEEQVVVKPDSVPQVHNQALVQVQNQASVQESKTSQTQEPNVIPNPPIANPPVANPPVVNEALLALPPVILKNPLTSKKKKSSKKKSSKAVKANESGPQANENGPQANESGPQANESGPQANESDPQANGPQANENGPQANGNPPQQMEMV